MRRNILYIFIWLVTLWLSFACSDEYKYETSVIRQFELSLNGKPWSLNSGLSTKPFFIYKAPQGDFVANYSSHFRFSLENGTYRFVATPAPETLIPNSTIATNLNDLVINQFPSADKAVEISAAVEYSSPFNEALKLDMVSRTGTLRLRATDVKADKSYTTVRAIVTAQRSGYRVIDETYIEDSPIDITRSKKNDTGGINYTDDFVVFKTKDSGSGLKVRFEMLDKNENVVNTRELSGLIPIWGDTITLVEFQLNDTNNPIIQDYKVTVLSEEWTEEEHNPEAPFIIPEGYTYVGPEEDINTAYNNLKNDATVEDIKLYLKAGGTYTFTSKTLNDAPKGIYIVGQAPKKGDPAATVVISGNVSLGANTGTPMKISAVHFENLILKPGGDFFKFKNQDFEVENITFKNCEFIDPPATMWYQEADGDHMQVIQNFTIENCRFYNINLGKSGFLGLGTKQILPIYNIVFRNSTFHAKTLGTAALITNLNKIDKDLTVTIENCTCINLAGGDMKFFDLSASNTSSFTLNVKNNLFSGNSTAGKGTWFVLKNVTTRNIANNYYTKDFVLNNWGVEAGEVPAATVASMNELFEDATGGDLTIKDKTSEVYINRIGDPHWLN